MLMPCLPVLGDPAGMGDGGPPEENPGIHARCSCTAFEISVVAFSGRHISYHHDRLVFSHGKIRCSSDCLHQIRLATSKCIQEGVFFPAQKTPCRSRDRGKEKERCSPRPTPGGSRRGYLPPPAAPRTTAAAPLGSPSEAAAPGSVP